MMMVGCDFHTRFQQVAMLDPTTGEIAASPTGGGRPGSVKI
jgi:hypothetical protein